MCYNEVFKGAAIVKFCVLASGSSGNATFVATECTRLLVDAGLSRKEICARLASIGEDPAALDAILVTHEHSDHVAGLPVLCRHLDGDRKKSGRGPVPIFLTHIAATALAWEHHEPAVETFQAGSRFAIGDIEIDSFTIPHDAIDPVGFCFRAEGLKLGLVTDLGYIPDSIKFHLRGTHLLVLESNHDLEMLKVGPYPWSVKQRVMSRVGHLSNDVTCRFILEELDPETQTLVLGHLSEHNNHPAIVKLGAAQALFQRGLGTNLIIAERRSPTEVFRF